jgi:hypothetical protein
MTSPQPAKPPADAEKLAALSQRHGREWHIWFVPALSAGTRWFAMPHGGKAATVECASSQELDEELAIRGYDDATLIASARRTWAAFKTLTIDDPRWEETARRHEATEDEARRRGLATDPDGQD